MAHCKSEQPFYTVPISQVVATFTQHSESTPSKSSSLMESIDSGARSFPHIPEGTTTTTTTTVSTTRSTRQQQQQQQVGDEHMFHQKVCMNLATHACLYFTNEVWLA